jgi:uncharacterized membrane protein (DUF485 family)
MVGMIQILTYLLCIYLVFKGVEIYQIAAMSANIEKRAGGIRLGACMIVLSLIFAAVFWQWSDSQASSLQSAPSTPRMP